MKTRSIFGTILLALLCLQGCQPRLNTRLVNEKAPETFRATFETTRGDLEIKAVRNWSPLAVDRLYQLIKSRYYTDLPIYRVVPAYVAQFGVHPDSTVQQFWESNPLPDEPALHPNKKGTLAFARSGPHSRSAILYFNLQDNSPRLDTLTWNDVTGFPVVAEITKGLEVIGQFNDQYGNEPSAMIDSIQIKGVDLLNERFPGLDYIKKAYLINK